MVQWVCLKAWGPIQRSNIKNVWLTCERISKAFGFFYLFPYFFQVFFFIFFFPFPIHNGYFFHLRLHHNHFVYSVFLFGMATDLRIFCKYKSLFTHENWHFNLSLFTPPSYSTPFHAFRKVKNPLLLATTLWGSQN